MDQQNYYGSLCTMMYEELHEHAPEDELAFYLSYGKKGQRILEAMCGSGRFFVPFAQRGLDIWGVDLSGEMLDQLLGKLPGAQVTRCDLMAYEPGVRFDYIFVSSGSMGLFTERSVCAGVLAHLKELLSPGGKLVFAVDTVAARSPDDTGYRLASTVRTEQGHTLTLKYHNRYDAQTQTQYAPSIYELYDGERLLRREEMDFRIHLYRPGEMEGLLTELGFGHIKTYSSFGKDTRVDGDSQMLLLECTR